MSELRTEDDGKKIGKRGCEDEMRLLQSGGVQSEKNAQKPEHQADDGKRRN